jgi:hypothetical protein
MLVRKKGKKVKSQDVQAIRRSVSNYRVCISYFEKIGSTTKKNIKEDCCIESEITKPWQIFELYYKPSTFTNLSEPIINHN